MIRASIRSNLVRPLVTGGLIAALIAACAVQHKSAMSPVAGGADAPHSVQFNDNTKSEIERLSAELAEQRTKGGYNDPPPAIAATSPEIQAMTTGGAPPKSNDPKCLHGTSDTCSDVCTISDSICDTAKKICDLTAKMPGDAWAKGKCDDASASCSQAHDKCCACQ